MHFEVFGSASFHWAGVCHIFSMSEDHSSTSGVIWCSDWSFEHTQSHRTCGRSICTQLPDTAVWSAVTSAPVGPQWEWGC